MHRRSSVSMRPIGLPQRDFTVTRGIFAAEGLDFEVSFLEGILETDPDHVESLMYLGHAYTARGDHDRGLDVDLRLLRLRPDDPLVHYNLACSYALLDRSDEAVAALLCSVQLGYRDVEHIAQDEDLTSLRGDPRFQALVRQLQQEASAG